MITMQRAREARALRLSCHPLPEVPGLSIRVGPSHSSRLAASCKANGRYLLERRTSSSSDISAAKAASKVRFKINTTMIRMETGNRGLNRNSLSLAKERRSKTCLEGR